MADEGEQPREQRFDLARSGGLGIGLCLAALACPATGALAAAFAVTGSGNLLGGFTVASAVGWNGLFVLGLWAGVRQLRQVSGLAVEPDGLRLWAYGEPPWLLPWSEIAGVAIALRPSLGSWGAPRPSLWTLEIYLADPGAPHLAAYPELVEPPPLARLPQRRRLIALPMLAALPSRIEAAVRHTRLEAWAGRHEYAADPAEELWPGPA